jgi:hypothetical protein
MRTLEPGHHRQIEQQGEIRREAAQHLARQGLDERRRHATSAALVGPRRVGVAVADHPLTAGERRPDEVLDMDGASREHQQRLGLGRDPLRAALQHDLAQTLGERRAARFARCHDREPVCAQRRGEGSGHRALPGAFDAFQSDEAAARRHLEPSADAAARLARWRTSISATACWCSA